MPKYLASTFAYLLFCPGMLLAESVCRTEMSYSWRPVRAPQVAASPAAEAQTSNSPAPTSSSDSRLSPWVIIEQAGPDEAAARAKLAEHVAREKPKARAACTKAHEDKAQCVASKLAAMAVTLQTASFTARKSLESAIVDDCARSEGHCLLVNSSDPQCRSLEVAENAEGEAKDEKKDKKEDKKAEKKK
jgi:hypothetical protein